MKQQKSNDTDRKVNKNEFLQSVASQVGMPVSDVKQVYNAFVSQIKNVVCMGKDLSLTGFGTFMLKTHKGHPVRFEAKEGKVQDYVVLKFVASDVLMSGIREIYNAPSEEPEEEGVV